MNSKLENQHSLELGLFCVHYPFLLGMLTADVVAAAAAEAADAADIADAFPAVAPAAFTDASAPILV